MSPLLNGAYVLKMHNKWVMEDTDAETWEAQVHNGYVFTGDTRHGMRVRTFTGAK